MVLPSVVHSGVRVYSKSNSPRSGVSVHPEFRPRQCVGVQFGDHLLHSQSAARCRIRAPISLIYCSRRTEQNDDTSISEGKKIALQSNDDEDDSSNDAERNTQGHHNYNSSVRTVALCLSTAVAFGIGLGLKDGFGKASEFFAGYLLEQSLSVDNLFVFVLVFKYFKVPLAYQNRVLSYGIAGAIVFRLTLILLGAATLQRFEAVNLLLAAILLFSSFKLFTSEDDDNDLSNNFVVKTCQRFIPVTANYDGNRFITSQDGVWKVYNILGRRHLYFLLWQ